MWGLLGNIKGAPGDPASNIITSVFGRTGAVAAAANDYTMLQIAGTRITRTLIDTPTGAGTYTTPAGCKAILVECVGGGGGGGGVEGVVSQSAASGGGSGGGYASIIIQAPAATYPITIGGGGAGGIGAGNSGAAGLATIFGPSGTPICKAPGGNGGGPGASGTAAAIAGAGANIQTGWIGTLQVAGGAGGMAIRLSSNTSIPSFGGSSMWGGISVAPNSQSANGSTGVGYGVGGSGGVSNSATARNGGTGGQGAILVWEFY